MVGTKKLVLVLALSLLVVAPSAAQSVRGLLTDSLTSSPIPGAFVTMIDDQGNELARTITNAAGEFLLTASTPGRYRLRSKRIGFRPYVSAPLTLQGGETISFKAVVHPIPVSLASVVVEGDRQCDVAGGASVAAMWDEVREALTAVVWTSRQPNYWYDIGHFQRDLTPSGHRKGTDSTWRDVGYRLVPFQSAAPEELEAQGFVVPLGEYGTEGFTYWAPDAEVLVSNPFLRTHCFETKEGHGETSQLIGLAFTPAKGRNKPDVAGTLWLDRTTAELRLLEFTYKNLPQGLVAPKAGGTVEFMRLPSGTWIVHTWTIRMPLATEKQRPLGMGTEAEVVGFRETGGAAVEIKTRSGTVVFRSDSLATALAAVTPTSAAMAAAATDPAQGIAAASPGPAAAPNPEPIVPAQPDTAAIRVATKRHRTQAYNQNVLEPDEFEGTSTSDVLSLIQRFRPNWLATRGRISIMDQSAGDVHVAMNGTILTGDVSRLREYRAMDVKVLRFLNAGDAQQRYGSGHGGGVIEMWLK